MAQLGCEHLIIISSSIDRPIYEHTLPGEGTELKFRSRSTGGGVGAWISPTRAYIELLVEFSPV